MRYRLAQFMAGRNGSDAYSRFQSIVALVLVIISFIISSLADSTFAMVIGTALWIAGLVFLVLSYVRVFSRNLTLCRSQNAKYLQRKARFLGSFSAKRSQFRQRKDFCFFSCPSCKAVMRVPRGKGKVKIVCRKCGEAFVRKT